jgi:hypothetical protein
MARLLVLAAILLIGYRLYSGRWPWQKRVSARKQALYNARRLLGVEENAGRTVIIAAHKRLVALVHPDRGGTNRQVHEANDARDLLLGQLPQTIQATDQEPS